MANRAVLFIELGPRQVVLLCRLDGDVLGHLFVDARVLRLARKERFEWHIGVGGRDRRAAASEVEVHQHRNKNEPCNQSCDEFQVFALTFF